MTDPALESEKQRLRQKLLARRAEAAAANGPAIALVAAQRFQEAFAVRPGQVVAGYWPRADELDPRPLLAALRAAGAVIVLPTVVAKGRPLLFRRWDGEVPPPPGAFGIPAPPSHALPARPDLALVPLVGFDAAGGRLGLGAGFYDATLAAWRGDGGPPVLAVGYAFAVQQAPLVPMAALDQRLDWIVTERGAIRVE